MDGQWWCVVITTRALLLHVAAVMGAELLSRAGGLGPLGVCGTDDRAAGIAMSKGPVA